MKRIFFPLLILLLAACSGSPPVIHNSDWMPVYTKDLSRGGVYEELDLFVRLDDEDGLDDISEVAIHRDDRGWAWKLDKHNWVSHSADGESWIGANGLSRDGGIPDGEYRIRVTDRSGQSSEFLIEYASPGLDAESLRFPHASVEEDQIRLDGGGRDPLLLWFYDDKGDFVFQRYLSPGLIPRDELLAEDNDKRADWFMIYHRDEEGGYGLKSGPYLLNAISELPEETGPAGEGLNPQASASASATSEDS